MSGYDQFPVNPCALQYTVDKPLDAVNLSAVLAGTVSGFGNIRLLPPPPPELGKPMTVAPSSLSVAKIAVVPTSERKHSTLVT
jgi:hypothetical protein